MWEWVTFIGGWIISIWLGIAIFALGLQVALKLVVGLFNFVPGFGLGYLVSVFSHFRYFRPSERGDTHPRKPKIALSYEDTPKRSIFSEAGLEGRLAFFTIGLFLLLFLPIASALYLSAIAILSVSWPNIDEFRSLAEANQEQILFFVINFSGMALVAFGLTRLVYTFLLWRSWAQGYDAVVNFFQALAALPIVFLGISLIVTLKSLGLDLSGIINQYTVWIVLSVGIVPSLVAQLAHEAPATSKRSQEIIEQYFAIGARPLSAYYRGIVSTQETGRFLLWVSIWTAIRVVAELGVFKALTPDQEDVPIDQFVLNLMTNFGPENVGAFVVVMAVVGLIGLLLSTFRSG